MCSQRAAPAEPTFTTRSKPAFGLLLSELAVRLFGRATQALLRTRIADATDEQLRQLVLELLQQRKSLMPQIGATAEAA